MNPPSYTPAFQAGVMLFLAGNVNLAYPVSQKDCMTLDSALALAQLPELMPYISGIYYGPPLLADPDTFSQPVPWFLYRNGAAENAAQVGDYFVGNNYAIGVRDALEEIQAVMQAYGQGQMTNPDLTPIPGMSPIPAPAVPVGTPPAPLPVPPVSPVGVQLPDGRFQDLSINSLPIGAVYTAPDGTVYVKQGIQTPWQMAYWWVKQA